MMERLTTKMQGCIIRCFECKEKPYCYDEAVIGGCIEFKKVLKKLKEYEDLEEQGLIIKLPCKTNEIVFVAHEKYPTYKTMFVSMSAIVECLEEGYEIGRTKEEAEEKIKEKQK